MSAPATFPIHLPKFSRDPIGRPLDLVIYSDRKYEYFPHKAPKR